MNGIRVPAYLRGSGKSMTVALTICAIFVAGIEFDRFTQFLDDRTARKELLYDDFGQLGKYRAENLTLLPNHSRIIFFGDSITYQWKLEASFPGEPYLNRGIGAQTTTQLLVRFRQDVIDLQPMSVVILAGTNDLGDTSAAPESILDIERNLQTMAELAVAHQVRPVFESLLPVNNFTSNLSISATRSPQNLLIINKWLQSFCEQHGYAYVDYYSAMVAPNGMMRRELSGDGLHPNAAGYQIMTSIAVRALGTKIAAHQAPPESR
jgi:lysophospholipase L1-like esterase